MAIFSWEFFQPKFPVERISFALYFLIEVYEIVVALMPTNRLSPFISGVANFFVTLGCFYRVVLHRK